MKNMTLLTDLYQLTMMSGYYENDVHNQEVVFDAFFRKNACNGGYTIICGIEQVIDYINNLRFEEDDINYLRSLNLFSEDFLNLLKDFKFTGDIYSVEEGTILFPNEPFLTVKAPLIQAQLVETAILSIMNFQSLIATKASHICRAAQGDPVFEFGLRRAQGPEAGVYGARAAVIGGCASTSNVLSGKMFDIPVVGTHSHSWVQKFDTELDAFKAYAKVYPDSCLLLIDTYDTLNSGIVNAITVFKELREKGHKPLGIRLDSGDLAYLSKKVYEKLNAEGFGDLRITASNDLDEHTISSLKSEGAKINAWGVGTKLITSADSPSLGGVYKLAAVFEGDKEIPKIKISENPEKINNPGFKRVVRIYDENNMAEADLVLLRDEEVDISKSLKIFHPVYTWKEKILENYTIREMTIPIFVDGKQVYEKRKIEDTKDYVAKELDSIWNQYKRLLSPHIYKVDLSEKLWKLKQDMIESKKANK